LRILIHLITLWGLVLSAGCQSNSGGAGVPLDVTSSPIAESSATVTVSPTEGDAQMTQSLPTPADAGLQNLIDKAVVDLAQRLSIPITQITLMEARLVVWPDSSLGCPQPGMAYMQVQVDGLLIRLQAGEQIYEYHSGRTRDPFLCTKTVKDPNPPQIDILDLTPKSRSTPDSASTSDTSIPPDEDQ
jgi:hypothetical protein